MTDKSPIIGPSETPRTLVEYAAADAIEAVKARLELSGAHLEKMHLVIVAGDTDEVWDAVAAGEGIESAGELLSLLVGEAVGIGRQLGIEVKVARLNQG